MSIFSRKAKKITAESSSTSQAETYQPASAGSGSGNVLLPNLHRGKGRFL